MVSTAPSQEPFAGPGSMAPLMADGKSARSHVLDTHDKVLQLIARDADLAQCLDVIARAIKGLLDGADCLIIAFEPAGSGVVSAVATCVSLGSVLADLDREGGDATWIEDALRLRGMSVRIRHRIDNHAGLPLGRADDTWGPLCRKTRLPIRKRLKASCS